MRSIVVDGEMPTSANCRVPGIYGFYPHASALIANQESLEAQKSLQLGTTLLARISASRSP